MAVRWRNSWRFWLALAAGLVNLNCIQVERDADLESLGSEHFQRRVCVRDSQVTANNPTANNPTFTTPTRLIPVTEIPSFSDDLDFADMETAIDRQMARYRMRDLSGWVVYGQDKYSMTAIRDGLEDFRGLMRKAKRCLSRPANPNPADCWAEFNSDLKSHFNFYSPELQPGEARFGEANPVLFTAYYTPRIEVQTKPSGEFQFPIYMRPTDEWLSRVGRFQIDFRNELRNRGLELYYAKSLFDLYLLHLEGGGRLAIVDHPSAREIYVSYGGSNHREWRFISVLMLDKGWITNPSIDSQRQFIESHKDLQPEIFSYCPGYVYFKEMANPPLGSDNVPLTDNRSIATDTNFYGFKGTLAFVQAQRPRDYKSAELVNFARFTLDQDTGGAIKGKARVDFYFGEGVYAEQAAHTLKGRGKIFFILPKH